MKRTNTTGDKVLGRVQLDDAHGAVLPLLGCGGSQELRRHDRLGSLGQSLGGGSGDNSLLLRSKRQRSRQKVAEHRVEIRVRCPRGPTVTDGDEVIVGVSPCTVCRRGDGRALMRV